MEIYTYNPASQESRAADQAMRHPPKFKGTPPAQAKHNAKAARRFFLRLLDTNFTEKDTHTALTYADENLPENEDQAERDINNFLRHLRRECKKQGLPGPEALVVTEWQDEDKETGRKAVRFHHHVVLHCDLTRDEIEACWHRNGKRLGYANADRLRKDKKSLEALAAYLMKYTNRKHRYKRTRGIRDPITPPANDNKYTRRQIERICKDPAKLYSAEFWRRKYPGWTLTEAVATYNEFLGWAISLKMHRERRRE